MLDFSMPKDAVKGINVAASPFHGWCAVMHDGTVVGRGIGFDDVKTLADAGYKIEAAITGDVVAVKVSDDRILVKKVGYGYVWHELTVPAAVLCRSRWHTCVYHRNRWHKIVFQDGTPILKRCRTEYGYPYARTRFRAGYVVLQHCTWGRWHDRVLVPSSRTIIDYNDRIVIAASGEAVEIHR